MSGDGPASMSAVRLRRDLVRLLGEDVAGFDVDAIVRDLLAQYGAEGWTLGELHPDDYWVIIEKHDRLAEP
jgi:hypothetical protein